MSESVKYYSSLDSPSGLGGLDINSQNIVCNYENAINFKFNIDKERDEYQEREFDITFVCRQDRGVSGDYDSLRYALSQDMPPRFDNDGNRLYGSFKIGNAWINVVPCGISNFSHKPGTDLYKFTVTFFSNSTLWSDNRTIPSLS